MELIAGKYEVIREIGKGSYGKVYLVKHAILGIPYALKLLSHSIGDDQPFLERFKQEAAILQRFSHPGSIQLRDFGQTEDGQYYMAMDFCDGKPLAVVIDECGQLKPLDALNITQQVLVVLDAAHNFGIVHRDIKPENIMIEKNDRGEDVIKILDFGVAKLKRSLPSDSGSTLKGTSIGTPYYMSPEQAAGEEGLDHRADIYSVGIMLYEMLTGNVPFKGDTVLVTLLMHITRAPKPFAADLKLPQSLEDLVFKAIQKDKDHRFSSVQEFLNACVSVSNELKGQWSPAPEQHVSAGDQSDSAASKGKPATKILCLDDNEMILQILKHVLTQQGYEVFTATDYTAIHEYLFDKKASLLLCDVQMPGIPGTKICQMLKESLTDLKIALFSNLPDRDLEKLAKQSHADDWISKNQTPDQWIRRIKEIISTDEIEL